MPTSRKPTPSTASRPTASGRQRLTPAGRAARQIAISRLRSDREALSSRAARHPWSRPALRSADPTVRAEAATWFARELAEVTKHHGPPSLAVRVMLASAADCLELARTCPAESVSLLREVERARSAATRLAAAEARAWRRREREAR